MRFMNEFDLMMAKRRHADNPIILTAVTQVELLMVWANSNSDGWAYWPKPARAAAKMMELIEGNGTNEAIRDTSRATVAAYKKALSPIKAFRTKQGADFAVLAPPA